MIEQNYELSSDCQNTVCRAHSPFTDDNVAVHTSIHRHMSSTVFSHLDEQIVIFCFFELVSVLLLTIVEGKGPYLRLLLSIVSQCFSELHATCLGISLVTRCVTTNFSKKVSTPFQADLCQGLIVPSGSCYTFTDNVVLARLC